MLRTLGPRTVKKFYSVRIKSTAAAVTKEINTKQHETSDQLQELDTMQTAIPFSGAKIGHFFQQMPSLGNQFVEDVTLRNYLKRVMPENVFNEISSDLEKFGQRVATDVYDLAQQCERDPPRLQTYHAWGKRVDNIITCNAWKQQKKISAEEGLIAIAYERKHQQYSRIHQMAKNYLYTPSCGLYWCPLAMTDGATKLSEVSSIDWLKEKAYPRLTSRDPAQFWTSGQWMTERKGGSDVGTGTETMAVLQPDGTYKLYGYKWFSSATDSDMTIILARIVNKHGQVTKGTKGISMFYLEVRDEDGNLNNIEVQRLKDKLGTRQLPTAELLLDGAVAHRISDEGRGVAGITHMLTLSRLHNALASVGAMRRIVNLARDFSHKRVAFGKVIKDHPLHINNLAHMEVETRAGTLMTLELSRLLGLEEMGLASDHQQQIFRIVTPLAKLYTAKQAMAVTSEGLECFGGMGYLEDTGLPGILRDAQVLPIWEGTTNILSLDVLRAMSKSEGHALVALHKDILHKTEPAVSNPQLSSSAEKLRQSADQVAEFANKNIDKLELGARDFAYSLARMYMGALLVEHACWSEALPHDILTANRWCGQDLTPVLTSFNQGRYSSGISDAEYDLVMAGYKPNSKL